MSSLLTTLLNKHILSRSTLTRAEKAIAKLRYQIGPKELPQQILTTEHYSTLASDTVAIVAIYQRNAICANLRYILGALREHGIDTLVINNGALSTTEKEAAEILTTIYHERNPGLGRDFASYKLGVQIIKYAEKCNSEFKPNRFLFLNDSVFAIPDRYNSVLQKAIITTSPWLGVTESTEKSHHVSSWFFSISREVWTDPRFQSYWEKYLPLHSRHHAIHKGEIGFSSMMLQAGFYPEVIFNASSLMNLLKDLSWEDLLTSIRLLPTNHCVGYLTFIKDVCGNLSDHDRKSLVLAKVMLDQENTNQAAFWQLLACMHFNFPFIKKDLYARRVFTRLQLASAAEALRNKQPEISEIIGMVLKAPDHRSLKGLQRRLFELGLR